MPKKLDHSATIPDAKGTIANTVCKPFAVKGRVVTGRMIANAIDMLANFPAEFIAMDLVPAIFPDSDASFWDKQEALNRLFQRWRKLGLATFGKGRWRLAKGAWGTMQAIAMETRRAIDANGGVVAKP